MPFIFGILRSSRMSRRSFGIWSLLSIESASRPLPATNSGFETLLRSNARRTFMTSTSSSSTSRMFKTLSDIQSRSDYLDFGPEKLEACSLAYIRFNPHPAAFRFHDLLYDRQANSRSLYRIPCFQSLEYAEYPVVILRRDALAVVPNGELIK